MSEPEGPSRAGARRLGPVGKVLLALGAVVVGAVALGGTGLLGTRSDRDAVAERAVADLAARYGEAGFRIEPAKPAAGAGLAPAGGARVGCLLTADTPDQRSTGLMGVSDLGHYAGMVFRYQADSTGAFYMKDTPLPLSIAWFDGDGRFVSAADMEPCLGSPSCPVYQASGPYRMALEVPRGGLGPLGVGPGSRLVLSPTCS